LLFGDRRITIDVSGCCGNWMSLMDAHAPPPRSEPDQARFQTNYHRVQDLIRADIVEGRLEPNIRLKLADLAALYGVSPIPVREALQRLEGEGLVVISPNRGARVRVIDEDFLRNILDIILLLDPYLVRGFVEAAQAEDILELEAIQVRIGAAARANEFHIFHRENGRFHACIYRRHFNDEALRIVHQHKALLRTLSRKYPVNQARMKQSYNEHQKVLNAIRDGEVERAVQAMADHVGRSNAYILALLRADRSAAQRQPQHQRIGLAPAVPTERRSARKSR
jgi:DNA-binding GntR family transcriptional regulator